MSLEFGLSPSLRSPLHYVSFSPSPQPGDKTPAAVLIAHLLGSIQKERFDFFFSLHLIKVLRFSMTQLDHTAIPGPIATTKGRQQSGCGLGNGFHTQSGKHPPQTHGLGAWEGEPLTNPEATDGKKGRD